MRTGSLHSRPAVSTHNAYARSARIDLGKRTVREYGMLAKLTTSAVPDDDVDCRGGSRGCVNSLLSSSIAWYTTLSSPLNPNPGMSSRSSGSPLDGLS